HLLQRRVVADLEQVHAQVAGGFQCPGQGQRIGGALGVLPGEGVGAQTDHEVSLCSSPTTARAQVSYQPVDRLQEWLPDWNPLLRLEAGCALLRTGEVDSSRRGADGCASEGGRA